VGGWQLYLRRPPSQYPESRLDRLLAAKAAKGVCVHIAVYKEVTGTLPNDSAYTKATLRRSVGGDRRRAAALSPCAHAKGRDVGSCAIGCTRASAS
jgi:hypothetical protein